jgi:hypothetical protein
MGCVNFWISCCCCTQKCLPPSGASKQKPRCTARAELVRDGNYDAVLVELTIDGRYLYRAPAAALNIGGDSGGTMRALAAIESNGTKTIPILIICSPEQPIMHATRVSQP